MSEERADPPAATARRLVRALDRAALATSQDGWPYASLVLAAVDHDSSPLLLLSDLAEHSKNLRRDSRASLMFDGTVGRDDPLTGPRVTVLGEAKPIADPRLMARFTARHPAAAAYAGFADFHLYRLDVIRAQLVAGFGRIHTIAADALLSPATTALADAESGILQHMNEDHRQAIDLYATRIAGASGDGWRMTGIDPDGIDLRRGGAVLRLDFPAPVGDAEGARAALVRFAHEARGTA
jgi:heme iron utilization protein